ncbi:MAG TPA: DUF3563 family protein [Casimicrobiaceae bacterium]|nr:DUF3563 family protein [Casimicrobiaceae bacterium]
MKNLHPVYPEHTVLGTLIKMAQATFYEALPANVEGMAPIAPAHPAPPKRAPSGGVLQRFLEALDRWFYRQTMKEREAYLAQASNLYEVEQRMRELDRTRYH